MMMKSRAGFSLRYVLAASAGLAALSTAALAQETEPTAEDAQAASEAEVLLTEDGQLDLQAILAATAEEAQAASERLEKERAETERMTAELERERAETERMTAELERERAETAALTAVADRVSQVADELAENEDE